MGFSSLAKSSVSGEGMSLFIPGSQWFVYGGGRWPRHPRDGRKNCGNPPRSAQAGLRRLSGKGLSRRREPGAIPSRRSIPQHSTGVKLSLSSSFEKSTPQGRLVQARAPVLVVLSPAAWSPAGRGRQGGGMLFTGGGLLFTG